MEQKKNAYEIILKVLVLLMALCAIKLGIHKWIDCSFNASLTAYFCVCILAQMAAYVCLFVGLFRGKLKAFLPLGLLLLAFCEWQYAFEEHIYDNCFIHLVYMCAYIMLFLFAIVLYFRKNSKNPLRIKWVIALVGIFGIVVVGHHVYFLQQAVKLLLENPHNMVIDGFRIDNEHLIVEILIALLAFWIFEASSGKESSHGKTNRYYTAKVIPATLFFTRALYMLYYVCVIGIALITYRSGDLTEYFLRMLCYLVAFILMGVAILKEKRVLTGIASAMLVLIVIVRGSYDYYGLEYYAYLAGYLAVFLFNIAGGLIKTKSFIQWPYLLVAFAFLSVTGFLWINQTPVFIENNVRNGADIYIQETLANYLTIFFAMLWVICPGNCQRSKK